MEKHLGPVKSSLFKMARQTLKSPFDRVKCLASSQNVFVLAATFGLLFRGLIVFEPIKPVEAELAVNEAETVGELAGSLVFVQENSILAISSPKPQAIRTIKVVATGYSSSPWETDDTPHITAAGTWVRDGIVANNMLPFGVKVRIPELYGDRIFVVEDRMNWVKGNYHVDIWFSSYQEAKNFGAKTTYIEVLGS